MYETCLQFAPTKAIFSAKTAVQRKLEQEPEKSVRLMNNSLKQPRQQPRYQPPARQKPADLSSAKVKVSTDVAEKYVTQKVASPNKILELTGKLSQMRVSSGATQKRQQKLSKPLPPAMKTDYLGGSYEMPSARYYSRKFLA